MTKESKINIGVVGVGRLGSFHIEQYQLLSNVNIVGFYDKDQKKSKKIEEKYKIQSFDSLGKLVQCCEGVSIATPTTSHFEIAKECIVRNCHVLIEKPITDDLEHAIELVNLANKKKWMDN